MEPTQETETNTQPQAQAEISECPVCYKELRVDPHAEFQVLKCRICRQDFCLPCIKKWMEEQYVDDSGGIHPPHMNCPTCRCRYPVIFRETQFLHVLPVLKKQYKDIYLAELAKQKVQFARSLEEKSIKPDWNIEIGTLHIVIYTQTQMQLRAFLVPATENIKQSEMHTWIDHIFLSNSDAKKVLEEEFKKLRTTRIHAIFDHIRPPITKILFEQVTVQASVVLSLKQGEISTWDVEDPDIVPPDTVSILKREYKSRLEYLTARALLREFNESEDAFSVSSSELWFKNDIVIITCIVENHYISLNLFDHFKNELRRLISEQQQPVPASADVIEEDSVIEAPVDRMSGKKRRAAPDDDDSGA
jgi:hypothetical protein